MRMTNNVLICGLVLGFFIVGCGQNQESPKFAGEDDSAIEQGGKIVEQEVSQIKESIAKQAGEMIDKSKVEVEAVKDKTAATIKELTDTAYSLLDKGKYTEAISTAQSVLTNYDSASQDAKDIITKAKEKLQAMVEAKAKEVLEAEAAEKAKNLQETTITEKTEDLKDDLTKKLNSFGQ